MPAHRAVNQREKRSRSTCDACLVALDQPTIVRNATVNRPVDRVAASLVSFIGGGVQPANRSKKGMFDCGAPIWRFLEGLRATEDPELSRTAESDLFIVEVFPALALPAFDVKFYGRFKAPKYNPANRGKFRQCDWIDVIETVARYARAVPIEGLKSGRATLDARLPRSERPAKQTKTGSTPFCAA